MMTIKKLWVHGGSGRTGQLVVDEAKKRKHAYHVIGYSNTKQALNLVDCDIVVDFSSAFGTKTLLSYMQQRPWPQGLDILIATTALSDQTISDLKKFASYSNSRILLAPNTSLGVQMLLKSCLKIAHTLVDKGFDVQVTETHHKAKKDAPSGTAKLISKVLSSAISGTSFDNDMSPTDKQHNVEDKIGVHSLRMGGVFGEHEVRFVGPDEELTITHRAFSRRLFAQGVFSLLEWLAKQPRGVLYDDSSLLTI